MGQHINIGNQSNDGTGDSIRDAFRKVNDNFDELYAINNLSGGLYFTKLKDAPTSLLASTATSPSVVVTDNFGNKLLQKRIIAGQGISISNTETDTILIENPASSLSSDKFPQLGGSLTGNGYIARDFGNPEQPQDLVTLDYFEKNSIYSRVNLYVSTNGTDDGQTAFPAERRGRSLAYAYKTISAAALAAEDLINFSFIELSPYAQFITINNNATTASVYATTASTGIAGDIRLQIDISTYNGTDPYIVNDIRPGEYIKGLYTETLAFIDDLGQETLGNGTKTEYYDVRYVQNPSGNGFSPGEPLQYATGRPRVGITIIVESGIYYEHYPIRVPRGVSIRGDEFRRVLIRPAPLVSTSPWVRMKFRRDSNFDGMTRANDNYRTLLSEPGAIVPIPLMAYHYLSDPNDPTSIPKDNRDLDVFLLNDSTILRAISCEGHGGFMCVLDPEGQILTKSPYIQNCSSFSRSINKQRFSGGMFIDGFAGNQFATPVDGSTYFLGTTTIAVQGLTREPQTPFSFFVKGNRYEVDYVDTYNPTAKTATLHLNPRNSGGLAFTNTNGTYSSDGIITVTTGGSGWSVAPTVVFSQPTTPGGFGAQGTTIISGGVIQYVRVTNPGSGYTTSGTITISFVGGTYATPASTVVVPNNRVKIGFIGKLPSPFELGTAGNKSMLAADFTQVNDLGYGVVATNNGLAELVSVFTYYCYSAYFSNNGGQLRSLNGSCAYGANALKAEGADPNEIPIPVRLTTNMIQTATIVSGIVDTINAVNTGGSTTVYIRNYQYLPYNRSYLDVDHGSTLDAFGNAIGLVSYNIVSASTASSVSIPGLASLDLSTGGNLNLGGVAGLKAPISTGTTVVIRTSGVLRLSGVNAATIVRPSTALQLLDSTSTTYRVLGYDSSTDGVIGDSRVSLREDYDYMLLQTYGKTIAKGTPTIQVYQLGATDVQRLQYGLNLGTNGQMIFGWKDTVYKITSYTTGTTYATIGISPNLVTTITNAVNTGSTLLRAGLQSQANGEITTRISTMRATGHDMLNVGSGSYEQSNYPNDIFGPSRATPTATAEVLQVGKGRVFSVTSDQDGNFKVGNFFQVDQGTGNITFSANLSLTNIDGLGFKRGYIVKEFSTDDSMAANALDTVPVQRAVVGYVNRRLGLNVNGVAQDQLGVGSGYLDLRGQQSMSGSINMQGNAINMQLGKVVNIATGTNNFDATNKLYVDQKDFEKMDKAGTTMTGALLLYQDPTTSTQLVMATTRRYVDQLRSVNTLSDVTFTNPSDTDFLMFADAMDVSTATSKPLWAATRRIINVTTVDGSDIRVGRTANTTTFLIKNSKIYDGHVNASAAIQQGKLSMNTAPVGGWANGAVDTPVQSGLGLARFHSTWFQSTSGFISLNNPQAFPVNAVSANKVNQVLSRGSYLTGNNYDGSGPTTWAVDADTANTGGKIVLREAGTGNFSAGTITASLNGQSCDSKCLGGVLPDTAATVSTIAKRDSSCDLYARYFRGIATSAQYADLAENYVADQQYGPCTVLEFGGTCEVTIASDGTRAVAGVVSTNPAHLMNSGCQGTFVVAVALQGRVPCKVRGKIRKGDMMVSAGGGYARAEYNPVLGSVIGKALEDFDGPDGIIEVVVGRL
jgi:hypothetical protein